MKRNRIFVSLLIILLLPLLVGIYPTSAQDATPTPRPRPFPNRTLTENDINVELYFDSIQQGRAGLIRAVGANITGARARFFDRDIDFFQIPGDAWYGLIGVDMELAARLYNLSVSVWDADGVTTTLNTQVEVTLGGFLREAFSVPADRAYLASAEVERGEIARIDSITSTLTPERLWTDAGFQYPIASEITSPFGSVRVMNETIQTRHTGWDMRAPVGTPIMTMAAGRVAFAGRLDIRGNYVMIDHGEGIYTGYAHLSQVHVTRGQTLTDRQIIGVSGNTGRSGGPHLHMEVVINGEWMDAVDFLAMWLP